MNEVPENPFASPKATSYQEFREFGVSDRDVASRESFQSMFAAGLAIMFGFIWMSLAGAVGFAWDGRLLMHVLVGFMTLSCVATMANHWYRSTRALRQFPLILDEQGIDGKFRDGSQWRQQRFAWNQIVSVRFQPIRKMIVITTDGAEHQLDLYLLAARKWHPLEETLRYYSDHMAKT